ncbi:MAG: AAA family ATPase [Rhodobacter sp.]|nr:AAA family ATPase [Rhodobacter sp.]
MRRLPQLRPRTGAVPAVALLPEFSVAPAEAEEGDEARERRDPDYSDPEIRAVREVLAKVAGDSAALRSRKPDGDMDRVLYVRMNDGFDVPFEALSGGEKAFFQLAVDLARRLLLESPDKSLAEAPGFVCIDGIELHLHPAWQRTILTHLIDLFPRCQFVVSTHSPQVIGSVAAKHLRPLMHGENGDIRVAETLASKGRDSNHVLEGILDTPKQDPDVDRLFRRFDELIDAGEFEDADEVLDELDDLVEGGSPRVAVRRAKCMRLRQPSG